jgi:hypothetical protein
MSLPTGLSQLPLRDLPRAMSVFGKLSAHAARQLFKTPLEPLKGTDTWDLMVKYQSRYSVGSVMPDVLDVEQAIGNIFGVSVKGVAPHDAMLIPQRTVDMVTRATIWRAAFDRFVADNASRFASLEELHKAASLDADSVVHLTQPASSYTERALIQKGNEYVRAAIPFTAMPLRNWSMMRTQLIVPMRAAWKEGKAIGGASGAFNEMMQVVIGTQYAKDKYGTRTGTGQKFAMAYIIPAMGLSMIARGGLPDSPEEFLTDLFAYNITALPIFGPPVSAYLLYGAWAADGAPLYSQLLKSTAAAVGKAFEKDIAGAGEEALGAALDAAGVPKVMRKILRSIKEDEIYKIRDLGKSEVIEFVRGPVLGMSEY